MIHERIDPYKDKEIMKLSRLAHVKRYYKASENVQKNQTVLDAGCGYGYGSAILAKRASKVIGVDISPEAIGYAKRRYGASNIFYYVGNIEDNLICGPFDVITIFEVLEHIKEPNKVLRNFRKSITNNGLLFLSVPNGRNIIDRNEHHVNTYTSDDVEQILERNEFQVVEKSGQYPIIGRIARIAEGFRGSQWDTDKRSGLVSKIVDTVSFLPEVFSDIYNGDFAVSTSRTLYYTAQPK